MLRCTRLATSGVVAREDFVSAPRRSVGSTSRPFSPIAAAIRANSSAVASTLPWPIAVEPTARSSPISPAAGIVDRAWPASAGSALKPKFSAVWTSFSAPSSAPIGANTELHECANELISEPPQDSPLAFCSSTPSSVAAVCTGNSSLRLAVPASSAPVSVMILKIEPGGCGAENATPARASTSPSLGPDRGDAAVAAGERLDGGALDVGVDRRAHVLAALGRAVGQQPLAGVEVAAGRAAELDLELALEPVEADRRVSGHAAHAQLVELLRRGGADAPGDLGGDRSELGQARLALGDRRAVAGEDRRAVGHPRLAAELLAAAQPGEDHVRRPLDRGLALGVLADRDRHPRFDGPEHARARLDRDLDDAVARLAGARHLQLLQRGGLGRAAVRAREAAHVRRRAGLRREHRVHRFVVTALPGGREPLREPPLGRLVAAAGHEAAGERAGREQEDGRQAAQVPAPAAARGRTAGGHGAAPRLGRYAARSCEPGAMAWVGSIVL